MTQGEHSAAPEAPASAAEATLSGNMPGLDGVRGIAILMVLVLHFAGDVPTQGALEGLLGRLAVYGQYGVDLFFVLSGFLITGILVDSRQSKTFFRGFYARRALRIFPLYYAVLAGIFFVAPLVPLLRGPTLSALRAHQGWAWLYAVNIYDAVQGGFSLPYIDHFWSLAVEEHFYLVWPLVVWLCPPKTLLRLSAGIVVVVFAARLLAPVLGVPSFAVYVLTPFRLDGLCLGGFLAVLGRQPGGVRRLQRLVVPIAALGGGLSALLLLLARIGPAAHVALDPARNVALTVLLSSLVVYAATATGAGWLRTSVLRALGRYSYGLYVYHHLLSFHLMRLRTDLQLGRWLGSHLLAIWLQAALGIGASFLVAAASYHLFEEPFLRLKSRLAPGREPRAAPRPAAAAAPQ